MLPEAYVTRIITSKEGEEAVAKGVEFKHGGKTYTVNVGKEVIVSARYALVSTYIVSQGGGLTMSTPFSTVKSPHILELSGIGNRKILEKLDIPVQVDLPTVGENLQDHLILANPVWGMCFRLKPVSATFDATFFTQLSSPTKISSPATLFSSPRCKAS